MINFKYFILKNILNKSFVRALAVAVTGKVWSGAVWFGLVWIWFGFDLNLVGVWFSLVWF